MSRKCTLARVVAIFAKKTEMAVVQMCMRGVRMLFLRGTRYARVVRLWPGMYVSFSCVAICDVSPRVPRGHLGCGRPLLSSPLLSSPLLSSPLLSSPSMRVSRAGAPDPPQTSLRVFLTLHVRTATCVERCHPRGGSHPPPASRLFGCCAASPHNPLSSLAGWWRRDRAEKKKDN